jgi:hypothetical protein
MQHSGEDSPSPTGFLRLHLSILFDVGVVTCRLALRSSIGFRFRLASRERTIILYPVQGER